MPPSLEELARWGQRAREAYGEAVEDSEGLPPCAQIGKATDEPHPPSRFSETWDGGCYVDLGRRRECARDRVDGVPARAAPDEVPAHCPRGSVGLPLARAVLLLTS